MSPKKQKVNLKEIAHLRNEQLQEIINVIDSLKGKIKKVIESKNKELPMLNSVSRGLYEELDKLCKKAPAESITDLILEQVNDIIKETKSLAETDPFVQKLNEFIPAGDNPQQRDVVVVLRQIRQGLQRYEGHLDLQRSGLNNLLEEAEGIQTALYIFIEDKKKATDEYLEDENDILDKNHWFTDDDPRYFDYEKLDKISIQEYFLENK